MILFAYKIKVTNRKCYNLFNINGLYTITHKLF